MSGIYRTVKDKNYFYASNEPFNDARLSWEARGVIGYLLSKPDGWVCRNYDLEKQGTAGGCKLKRILAELRQYGYLRRYRQRNANGTFEWVTEVFESPRLNPTIVSKSTDGSSTDGSSTDGKPTDVLITDLSNTESVKTKKEERGSAFPRPPAVDVYRKVANRFPDKATWPMLEKVTDLEFWEQVIINYIACGWSKVNIKTMLEFYDRRELPAVTNGNGRQNGRSQTKTHQRLAKPVARAGGLGPPCIPKSNT